MCKQKSFLLEQKIWFIFYFFLLLQMDDWIDTSIVNRLEF